MLLHTRSYPRAGFLGNPSDGYFGKTIAFAFTDFCVDVDLYESPEIEFLPGDVDDNAFASLEHLTRTVQHYGYYGGVRLVKAVSKVFTEQSRPTISPQRTQRAQRVATWGATPLAPPRRSRRCRERSHDPLSKPKLGAFPLTPISVTSVLSVVEDCPSCSSCPLW